MFREDLRLGSIIRVYEWESGCMERIWIGRGTVMREMGRVYIW